MGKKINQLSPSTDDQANENDRLLPLAEPVTGIAQYVSIEQLKNTFMIKTVKHIGTSGTNILLSELENMNIVFILRETGPIFEVDSSPDPAEFTWDLENIELGTPQGTGERFLIGYQNFI